MLVEGDGCLSKAAEWSSTRAVKLDFLGSNPGSATNELCVFKEVIRSLRLSVLICEVGIIIVHIL